MKRIALTILVALLLPSGIALAATYYIDFDGGSDANNGTAKETPWKHCPGDPFASGVADGTTLNPGDTVLFRGGVTYRGSIVVMDLGTTGSEITFKGDSGWGAPDAILDGADAIETAWTQCTTSGQVAGNSNWADIWYTSITAGTVFKPVYEDASFLWFAQDPNPTEPIFYDRIEDMRTVPLSGDPTTMTRTSLTDPTYLNQTDAGFWTGAYVLAWVSGNEVVLSEITSFSVALDTVYFADLGSDLYDDRDGAYSLIGHVSLIDRAGESAILGDELFIWPNDSDNPDGHSYSISQRKVGIDLDGCSHIVVEGFDIRGFHGLDGEHLNGSGVRSVDSETYQIDIRNNEIHLLRSLTRKGGVYILEGSYVTCEGNYIHECQKNSGALLNGERIYFDDNIVEYVGYVGIWMLTCSNSRITGNLVQNIRGTHANGISVYQFSSDVLVAGNRILVDGGNWPLTVARSEGVYIIGNLVDGLEESKTFARWNPMTGLNYVLQNNFVRALSDSAIVDIESNFILQNNIIDGGVATSRTYNLYVGERWDQDEEHGWFPGVGEIVDTDTGAIFVDYANGDFNLFSQTVTPVGAGTDVSALYPTALFPDYDFTVDLNGDPRPGGGGWTMGAFEFAVSPAADKRVMIRRD